MVDPARIRGRLPTTVLPAEGLLSTAVQVTIRLAEDADRASALIDEPRWKAAAFARRYRRLPGLEGVAHRQSPRWRGNLDRAETYLRLVVARRPDPVALVALARCLEEKGDQFSLEIERLVSAVNREIQRIVAAVATAPAAAGPHGVGA